MEISNIKSKTLDICFSIANKMKDEKLLSRFPFEKNIYFPGEPSISLSHGYPGEAIFFTELNNAFPNREWDRIAHNYYVLLVNKLEKIRVKELSLYNGWTGIAYSIFLASGDGQKYKNLLSQTNKILIKMLPILIDLEKDKLRQKKGIPVQSYDVIYGLTGIGRYLLANFKNHQFELLLRSILQYLVNMTEYISRYGHLVPGWFTPRESLFSIKDQEKYPNGCFNCGLAHGVPGPLSLLSLAYKKGIEVQHHLKAIDRIVEWLLKYKQEDNYGVYWPNIIPFEVEIGREKPAFNRTRDVWCYGTAGVARSLFLAGEALGNKTLKKISMGAINSIFSLLPQDRNIESPILCHGNAGLLQITYRMAKDNKDLLFQKHILNLLATLINQIDPKSPLLFYDLNPKGEKVYKRGFLEGSAGIVLAMLTVLQEHQEFRWDELLLIN